jgi:acetyl-CoA carboxylase carboxyltransferase component
MIVTWEVDDGYVGPSRPQKTEIPKCDIKDCENVEEALQMIDDMIQEDYEQKINWYIKNKESITDKVIEILENREDDDI